MANHSELLEEGSKVFLLYFALIKIVFREIIRDSLTNLFAANFQEILRFRLILLIN
jgi:hypothetical protein